MNWPNRYLAGTDCNWNIEAPIGHQLVVDIDMFDIGGVKNKCDNIYASVTGKVLRSIWVLSGLIRVRRTGTNKIIRWW